MNANLLVAAVERHPAIVVFAVLVAVALVAYAADWFVGRAERDDPAEAGHAAASRAARLKQWWCGVRRNHDEVLHFEGKRVNMRCTSCGHDTPGWDTSGRGPRVRYEGDARRHLLVPCRLVIRKSA